MNIFSPHCIFYFPASAPQIAKPDRYVKYFPVRYFNPDFITPVLMLEFTVSGSIFQFR